MAVKGVDISENNPEVDFAQLKAAGIEFVLLRCGYGSDYRNQDDEKFLGYVEKAQKEELPYGVYLYSYALNTVQAESEAAHAIRLLKQVPEPAYGVWFDMEDADHYKANHGMPANSVLVDICDIFCKRISKEGYHTGIYASLSWLENELNDPRLDRYDKWVAQWNNVCEYKKEYGIWQFTDQLYIGGKRFDGNWAYRDYPSLSQKREESALNEAQIRKIVQEEIAGYFIQQAKKPVSIWAQPAVAYCRENGIMNGDRDGTFRPQSFITRQESAQVAMELHKQLKQP